MMSFFYCIERASMQDERNRSSEWLRSGEWLNEGGDKPMRNQLPDRSTQFSFSMWKCAVALLCCAFAVEPLFAQELDWKSYGNDVLNQRYQNIDQITPANVSQLKPAWVFNTGIKNDPSMSMEMTPLIVNGVMYITTGDDDVFALDPVTGQQIWVYRPSDMVKINTLPVCCNNDNRGVAYGQGLIFDARLDGQLVALYAKTGNVAWKVVVDVPTNGAGMTLAPQFIGANQGTVTEVLVGVTGGEFGVRGHLDAYAPGTGKLLWRFYTTEPTTWAGGTSYLHGGASIWGTPTFDPNLNMVYFATGNAYPWPYAGGRAGTNLYATCIVALDATTGKLQWYHQWTHHDMWDFDGPQPTVLFTFNGTPALEHTSKTGYMFILDRASGQPLVAAPEVPVPATPANAAFQQPWPTQPESSIASLTAHQVEPDTLGPGMVASPMWTTTGPTATAIAPWAGGGMEWPPAAYSPRTGMFYSHSSYGGINVAQVDLGIPANEAKCPPLTPIGAGGQMFCGGSVLPGLTGVSHGVYGAVNPSTGKIGWTIPILTTHPDSGMTVAGDLVFFGDSTNLFYAANAATGQILWVFNGDSVPGAAGGNASAAVYEMNGVEYVVYGFGGEPGNSYDLGDAVISFALPSALTAAAAKAKAK
jgi:quinohemoprotein ethanol dehydrogenase